MTIKGKTKTGFEYEYDDRVKSDWRLLRLIGKIEGDSVGISEKVEAIDGLLAMVFKDKGEALMTHIAELNGGYMDINLIAGAIGEIITGDPDLKK